jgi:hypothetical protein
MIGMQDFILLEAIPLFCDKNMKPLKDAVWLSQGICRERIGYITAESRQLFLHLSNREREIG